MSPLTKLQLAMAALGVIAAPFSGARETNTDSLFEIGESVRAYLSSEDKNRANWRVYLLRCADGSLYCGITVDLVARLVKHRAGTGSKYTRARLPLELACVTLPMCQRAAMKLEALIKRLPANRKLNAMQTIIDEELLNVCRTGSQTA